MLVTGVAMIFKPATRSVIRLYSQVRADPDFGRSKPVSGRAPIGVDAAVAAANAVFPDGRLHWVLLPSTPGWASARRRQAVERRAQPHQGFRNVSLDQYSGQTVVGQDRKSFTAGERFLEWLFPLHSGEAFGAIGRPLTLLFGLIPLALYVTGFIRWRQKRRSRQASSVTAPRGSGSR